MRNRSSILFHVLAGTSVLMLVAAASLWIRGEGHVDTIEYSFYPRDPRFVGRSYYLTNVGGRLWFGRESWGPLGWNIDPGWRYDSGVNPEPAPYASFWRFYFTKSKSSNNYFSTFYEVVGVPLWLFCLGFSLPPLFWLRRRTKRPGRGFVVEVEDHASRQRQTDK